MSGIRFLNFLRQRPNDQEWPSALPTYLSVRMAFKASIRVSPTPATIYKKRSKHWRACLPACPMVMCALAATHNCKHMRGWKDEGSECGKVGDLHMNGLRDGGGHYKKEGKKTGQEMSIRLGFAPPWLQSSLLTKDKTIANTIRGPHFCRLIYYSLLTFFPFTLSHK